MRKVTIFGRNPVSLLCSLILLVGCAISYYYVYQANTQLKPVLPPLAAQRHLQQWLEYWPDQLMGGEALYHLDLVTDIYRRTNYRLLWLKSYELSEAGETLLRQLRETGADEIIDYSYHLAYLQQRLHKLPARPKDATAIDILLTDAFVSYAEDVLNQHLLPEKLALRQEKSSDNEARLKKTGVQNATFYGEVAEPNPHSKHPIITSLITENENSVLLNKSLMNLEPPHSAYKALRTALQHYQSIAAGHKWRPLAGNTRLEPGTSTEQVVRLRTLLKLYGDYPPPQDSQLFNWFSKNKEATNPVSPDFFDADLAKSLKHFQQRHGLVPSGIVDKKTHALLNVPPSRRIKQIALNMKRWRALPEALGERYIWVNLTDYRLDVIDRGHSIMNMKVIVGKKSRRTPVMYESINSLVFNPQWNVPRRIMVRDILPQLKKDPLYLTERNIRIINGWQEALEVPLEQIDLHNMSFSRFPYRLQQDPGADNALGVVKFVIPNDDSIYLHDTNNPQLFAEHQRALSSGCVRVEKPVALAALLLQEKRGWNRQKIDGVLAKGETTYVKLPQAIPTYLLYWTVWVDREGRIQFRDDIYGEDSVLLRKPPASLML